MRETGIFEGLFDGSELKVENIKDKEGKIAFLQKIISAVGEFPLWTIKN